MWCHRIWSAQRPKNRSGPVIWRSPTHMYAHASNMCPATSGTPHVYKDPPGPHNTLCILHTLALPSLPSLPSLA